jgi:two-component system, NarL family, response regulator LiaR
LTNEHDNQPIRILIVDDHDMVRMGLKILIESVPDLIFVGEASSGKQAVTLYQEVQPDVVLMDILMPEMDGIAATKIICDVDPNARIIALTSHTDEGFVKAVLEAGAISYLLKGVSSEDLLTAIENACYGQSTLAPQATQALMKSFQVSADDVNLSPTEVSVLQQLAKGLSQADIAATLSLSVQDIQEQLNFILRKIKASTTDEAAAWAENHNYIDPGQ